jgi:hypothetical protein
MADRDEMNAAQLQHACGLVLSGMQLAVFERLSEDAFAAVNAPPGWFAHLAPGAAGSGPAASLTACFPALEGFLPTAEVFWGDESTSPLQSEFWTETDAQGIEYHLLALAVKAGGRSFLVLERADERFIEHQRLQLYAHETSRTGLAE